MTLRIALLLLLLGSEFSRAAGVSGSLPLYVYVFVRPAKIVLSSEILLDRDIDVSAGELPHALTGRITKRDGRLFARLHAYYGRKGDGKLFKGVANEPDG